MESRKIQTSVGGSYILTLPKIWAEHAGVKRGDRVEILTEEDGSLRIYPVGTVDLRKSVSLLRVQDFPTQKLLDLSIKASYIHGHDSIQILGKQELKPQQKKWIKSALSGLTGVEISEELPEKITIQTLIDPSRFHIDAVTRRFWMLAISVYQDALKALRDGDIELARDALERGNESAKLYRLMMRQVIQAARHPALGKQIGLDDMRRVIVTAVVARDLSRLAFHARRIAQHVIDVGSEKPRPEMMRRIFEIAEVASQMQNQALSAFFKVDTQLANKVIEMMQIVRSKYEAGMHEILRMKTERATAIKLSLLFRDLRAIASYAVAVADDCVMRAFCEPKQEGSQR